MLRAKDITHAHKVLKDVVVNTPLDYDHYLSEKYQAKIYLKKENMQRVRSLNSAGLIMPFLNLMKRNVSVGLSVLLREITPKEWPILVRK